MPSLQVRELPQQIYHKLVTRAKKEHRSLAQQAIVTLAKGLDIEEKPKKRRANLVQRILQNPLVSDSSKLADPVELIRKDRER